MPLKSTHRPAVRIVNSSGAVNGACCMERAPQSVHGKPDPPIHRCLHIFEAIPWRVATPHNMRAVQHQSTGSSGTSSTTGRVLAPLNLFVAGKTSEGCASVLTQSNATRCNPTAQLWPSHRDAATSICCALASICCAPCGTSHSLKQTSCRLKKTDQTSQVCAGSLNNLGERSLTLSRFEWALQDSGRILQKEC